MIKKIVYEFENNRMKDFLLSLFNKLFIVILAFLFVGAIFYPIKLNAYKDDRAQMNQSREKVLSIGLESKLMHSDNNQKQVYSLTASYKYYVITLLRYAYEKGDYDLDTDVDKYKSKQELVDAFPLIEGYNDDFLGYFYTSYALDKSIVDYGAYTPSDYFKYEVLKLNDSSKGGEFFIDNSLNVYPQLKSDVRTALFSYVVVGASSSSFAKVDSKFFSYFTSMYEEAGNVLMKYAPYKEAYDSYSKAYDKLYKFDQLTVYVSFFSACLIISIIIPLFNKRRQNLSQLILKKVDLNSEEKVTKRVYITRFIYDIFKNFPSIIFVCLLVSPNVLFDSLFYIGSFPFTLFSLTIAFMILNTASLMMSMIRKDHRNLCSVISDSDNYTVRKVEED